MPTGVAQVADYDILPGPLHLRALCCDRHGGSTEEIDWCEDIQEVHPANHNGSNSASYDGMICVFEFVLQFMHGKVFRQVRHPWVLVLSLVQMQIL